MSISCYAVYTWYDSQYNSSWHYFEHIFFLSTRMSHSTWLQDLTELKPWDPVRNLISIGRFWLKPLYGCQKLSINQRPRPCHIFCIWSHFLGIPNLYPYPGLGNRVTIINEHKRPCLATIPNAWSLHTTHSRVFWELRSGNVWLNCVFMCWIFCLNLELKTEGKMKNKSATHAQHQAYPTEQDIKYRPFSPEVRVCFEKLSSQHLMLWVEYIK